MTVSEASNTEFYIVDFDRTLADTDKMTEVFIEIAEQYGAITREQILKADADVKQTGDSFDTAGFVRDYLADAGRSEDWDQLEKQYIHESRALNYLLPGAAELLQLLNTSGRRHGILTYGNPLWQRIKLTAAGFNHVHHIIMQHKEKGRFISSWQQPGGGFKLPEEFGGGMVDGVVLIDDKAVSFADFPPEPSRGFWVLDPSHELSSQQGNVPNNVTRYAVLSDIIPRL